MAEDSPQLSKQRNGLKRKSPPTAGSESPPKKVNLLQDDDLSDSDSEKSESGKDTQQDDVLSAQGLGFSINQDYARRFEHNKKREELHRRTCSPFEFLDLLLTL